MTQMLDSVKSEPNWENLPRQGGNAHNSEFLVRETYKQFFNSESGSLPWQRENCNVGNV